MPKRFVWFLLTTILLTSCSDEIASGDPEELCPDGERFDPILTTCRVVEELPSAQNGQTENGQTENGQTENGQTENGQTENSRPGNSQAGCGPGNVIGRACTPAGEVLIGATVTLDGNDCSGQSFTRSTTTGPNGEFSFDRVDAGRHNLTVVSGSFSRTSQVIVNADQTTDLTTAAAKVCLDASTASLAVIGGSYDHIEGILDRLGLRYDMKGDDGLDPDRAALFLSDFQAMKNYDIIFINCGGLASMIFDPVIAFYPGDFAGNLRRFVEEGGSLYVSDQSYTFVEKAFPDMINFIGDDNELLAAAVGWAPQTIAATVASPVLRTLLGRDTAEIEFPEDPYLGISNMSWIVAEGVGATSVAHLTGDAETMDIVNFENMGAGPTQPDSPLLVTLEMPNGGGTVIYTAFHNERQTTLNHDMDRILQYLVFQL
jgi:hypothetical protein